MATVLSLLPLAAFGAGGGPDMFGYKWSDTVAPLNGDAPVYSWVPITGTALTLSDDQLSAAIALPFTFNFYGVPYTQAYVSSNGFVSFTNDSNGCCSGVSPPSTAIPNGMIAFHWNDMYPPAGGTVKYTSGGTAPNRYFVVEVVDLQHFGGSVAQVASVQTWLYENGSIILQINTATSDGSMTMIGLENAAGTDGLSYVSSAVNGTVASARAVKFYRSPPTQVAFSTPAQTVTAGGCSAATTVQVRDSSGLPTSAQAPATVNLSSTSAGNTFYSGAGCTGPITQVTIPTGGTSATFYWRDNSTGTPTLTAASMGLTSGTQVQTVRSTGLVFTTAPQTVLNGACSGIVMVQNQNGSGAAVNVATATTVSLSSTSGTLQFFATGACSGSPITSTAIAAGSSTATFFFLDPNFGSPTVTVTAAGLSPGSQLESITSPPPSEYPWQAAESGTLYTDQAWGEYNFGYRFAPTTSGRVTRLCGHYNATGTVRLYNATTGAVLASATVTSANAWQCAPVSPVALVANQPYTVAVYLLTVMSERVTVSPYFPSQYGSVQILGSCYAYLDTGEPCYYSGLITTDMYGMADIGFLVDPPTRLALTSPAQTLVAGACSAPVTVQSQNAVGPAQVQAATSVALTSSSGTTTFYAAADTTCATPLTAVTLAAGASTVQLRFKDTTPGNPTLTATAPGLTPGAQVESVFATRLAFTSAPQTVQVGLCSGAVTVQNQNAAGGAVNVASTTAVALASSSTQMTFYSNATCTTPISAGSIAAGTSTATFYFKDLLTGGPTLTATAPSIVPGTQSETITPCGVYETPLTTNATGTVTTGLLTNGTAGYRFTPSKPLTLDGLCGYFSGTKTMYLWNASGTLLAQASVTSANGWSCATIAPVKLDNGAGYIVGVSLGGSGVAERDLGAQTNRQLPKTWGSVTIDYACSTTVTGSNPCASSINYEFIDGVVDVRFVPEAVTALAISSAPQTVPATSCSGVTNIDTRGCNSSVQRVTAATGVSLTSSAATTTFYAETDTTCATPIASVTVPAGASSVRFRFKDTVIGTPTLTAASTGLTSGAQVETIVAAGPTRVGFAPPAQTLAAGSCSAAFSVQSQDGAGNPSNVTSATVVSLSTSAAATGRFYSDASCTTQVTGVTLAAGTSSAPVYYRDTLVGSPSLTASASGLTSTSQTESIIANTASVLAFTTAAQSVPAGGCSAVTTLRTRDAYGNVSAVGAATAVTLSSSSAQGRFYSDASCTVQVSGLLIAAGASTASFYFADTIAGAPTLTASAGGFTNGTQTQTITAGGAVVLAFVAAPPSVTAGGCSGALTVQSQDAFGNPANVGAATVVSLATTSGAGTFYALSACGTVITSSTIAAGTSSTTFYYGDTVAGAPTLTASAAGLSPGTLVLTVVAGTATRLRFASSAQTLQAGACSALATAQAQDAFGNPSNVTAATVVSLASTSGGGTFYSNAACTTLVTSTTIAAGTSSAGFYFKDTVVGSPTLTLSGGLASGTQVETITPAPADRLAFTTVAQALTAGNCSAIATVQSRDASGNVSPLAAATAVTLSITSSGGSFYSDPGCTSSVASVTIAAGASAASFYFKDTLAGSHTLTASAAGLLSATQTDSVTAAAPNRLAFTSGAQTVTAGACSGAAVVADQDVYGNVAPVAAVTTVALSSSAGASNTFYSDSTCTTVVTSLSMAAGASTVTLWFKDTLAGTVTQTASASGLTPASQVETVNAAAPNRLVFTTASQTLTAGSCSAITSLQSRDAFNNPSNVASSTSVGLSSSSGTGTFYSDASCTAAVSAITIALASNSASFYFKDTTAGSPTLTATAAGLTAGTQVETINPPASTRLVFTSTAQTLQAGGCSALATVQSQTSTGLPANVVTNTAVALTATSGTFRFYADSTCTTLIGSVTILAGTSTASFYFKDTAVGGPTITGASAGFTSANQTETINPAAAARIDFTSAAQTLQAGGCSAAANLQTRDAFGNASSVLAATTVTLSSTSAGATFYSDAACSLAASSLTLAAGANSGTFFFKDTRAGAPTLTAAAAGLTSGTQAETINAAAPAKVAFTTAAKNQVAGACSTAATVQTQDGFNNASNVAAPTAISLATTSTGGTFYSDSTCTTAIASVTVATGTNAATFYFKDTRSGSPTLTASSTGLTSATQVETITAAAAMKLVFTTAAQSRQAGQCSLIATTQTQDTFNNLANVTASTTLTYSAVPATVTFYSDSTCTTVATTQTMAIGTANRSFYFKSTTVGSPVITVAAAGLTSATQTETITPAAASVLAFTTAAQAVQAGGCSAVTGLQSRDTFGNTSAVTAATAVTLSDSSGQGTFYSNSTCTVVVSSVTIAAGTSAASFYWKDTRAGSSTLTAAATGFTSATQLETISAAVAAKLAIVSAPQTVTAGACSLVATVQSQDAFNNASNVAAATTVNLSSSSAGGTFYTSATCTTAVTSVQLAAATNTIGFYFKDSVTGTPTITVAAVGLTSATQTQTITAAPATRLAFITAPQTVTAGSCSGVATLQSQDGFGNPTAVAAATAVNLTSSSAPGTFFSDASCTVAVSSVTLAAASQTVSFYYSDTAAGGPTLTAAAGGFTSATQTEAITAAAPARLVYLTAPVTVTAGSCSVSGLTVQSQDAFGNPSTVGAATSVSLSSTSASTLFSAAGGCATSTSSVTINAGTSTTSFFFKDTVAGTLTLTATAVGLTAATQAETVSAGTATALVFTTAAQSLTAGACSAQARVQRRDALGNPTPVGGAITVGLSSNAGSTRFFSDASCTVAVSSAPIASGADTATFYFTDSVAGSPIITTTATGLTFASQTETIVAGPVARVSFASAPQTLTAGTCSAPLTVQSRDANSNAANVTAATSVSLSTTSTGGAFFADATCTTAIAGVTIAAGSNSATLYFKDTRSGSPTLTASSAGLTPGTQIETITAAGVTAVAFGAAPQTVTAGACSASLQVQTRDAFGNAANTGAATAVTLSSTSAGNTFYSDSTCTTVVTQVTVAAGASTAAAYFKDTRSGTPTLGAASAGLTSGSQVETVTAAAATKLAFTTPAQTLSAGACSALNTAQVRDTFDNAAPGASARTLTLASTSGGNGFFSDASCTAAITSVTVAAGASSASFYFKDNNAGTPTLTVSSAGLTSATQVQTVNPAAASRLVFLTAAQTLNAGACSALTTLQSQDTVGNPSNVGTATAVSLSSTSAGGRFYSDALCTVQVSTATIAAGASTTSFYFKDTVAGSPTLSTAATGFTTGTQTQVINAAAPVKLVVTTAAQTLTAGNCSALTNVQSQDTFNNPSNLAAATAVTLTSSSAGGTFYSDAACTTAIAGLSIPAGQRNGTFYFKDTRSGGPTLTGAATGLTSATQLETINPASPSRLVFVTAPQTLSAGGCSSVATLQAQDGFGNASPVAAATAITLGTTSTGGTFYSGAGCTGPIAGLTLSAGASSASFYFKDTRTGTPTLTGAAAGLTSATQVETISAAAPSRLAFLSPSQTLTAGGCSALVTVQSQDAFANPSSVAAATAVTLSTTSSGGTFYSDAACTVGVTGATIAAGGNTATLYFKDTRAGSPTLTASASGLTATTQSESINPAAPSRFAFASAPLTLAAGSCSAALTVEAQDAFGNPSPVGAATTVSLATSSTAGTFYQTGSCGTALSSLVMASGTTQVTFFYGDTRAGSPTLTASGAGFSPGSQVETVTSASATKVVVISAAQSLSAGTCSPALTVQAQDGFNNPAAVASATTVTFSSTSAGGTFAAVAGCGTTVTGITLGAGSSSLTFYLRDTRAGSPTITAAAAGLTSGSQVETITAAPAARVAFLSAPQSLIANGCSALASVQTQDGFGNASNVTAATALSLTSSSTGGTFYSDATCATLVTSTSVAAGANTAGFYFKDTRAGSPTLTVSGGTLSAATQAETITAAAPARLAFTSAAQSVIAGSCSAATVVQSQDGFGNASSVAAATSVALTTTSSGGTFYSDAACTVTVASANIPAGSSSATFYFKDTRTGTPTLTASAAGLAGATQAETITAATATRLAFTTPARTTTAGGCSAVLTLQTQDAFGNASALTAAKTVTLSSTSTGGTFYADAACGTMAASLTIAIGASTGSFYYRDTRSGSPQLTAAASGLTSALQTQTVNPASPSKLVFASVPQTLTAGGCSAGAVIQTRDPFDNVANVTASTSVTLATTSTGGTFFSDAACGTAAASVTIAAGASSATFFFRDTRAGNPTLTASATGLTPVTQQQTINAAAASKLAFTSAAQTLTAGGCSALTALQAQDVFGNASNLGAGATVSLATTSAAGAFYSDAACTALVSAASIAAGASGTGFYFKDTSAGSPTLTASAPGLTTASQMETISPAPASRLAYLTLAQSVTAGSCSALTRVQTQDGFGNASNVPAATTVNLSSTSATMQFFSDASCVNQVATAQIAAAANTTTFYFKDTTAGSPTITSAAGGLASATQVETVNPAAAARLTFITAPRTITAGGCSLALTVQSQDNLGNPSPVAVATAVNLAASSGTATFYSDAACSTAASTLSIPAAMNSASAYFKDTAAGNLTVTASAGGFASGTQVEVVSPAAAAALAFVTAPQSLTANGCSALATVRTLDTYGNQAPVSAATTVSLGSTSAGGTFWSDPACTVAASSLSLAAGASSAGFYFKDTRVGMPAITAASAPLMPASQVESISAAAASLLVFTSAPQTLPAGGCSAAATLQTQDAFGNVSNVSAATSVALSSSAGSGTFYSDATCTTAIASATVGAGSSSATFFFKDTLAGSPVLTASAAGLSSATQTATITAGAPAKLVITSAAQTVAAGTCSAAVTLESRDAFDNPSANAAAVTVSLTSTSAGGTFAAAAGCGTAATTVTVPAGASTVSFFFKDSTIGTPTLTAAAAGLTSATQVETVNAGAPTQLVITSAAQTRTAGTCSAPVALQTRDAFGNVAPVGAATTVTLSTTSTGGTFFSDAACSTPASAVALSLGASSGTFYFRDTVAGSPTLTASATGLSNATQGETITAAAAARVGFTTPPRTVTAGNCSPLTTVQSQDTFGNAVVRASATAVTLTTTSAGGTFYSDASCTMAVTSSTIPAGGSSASFYFKDTRSGSPTLTAATTGLTSGTQGETINPASATKLVFTSAAQTITAGACSGSAAVQAQDPFNNPAPVTAATTVSLSSTSGTLTFAPSAACGSTITTVSMAAGTSSVSFFFKDNVAGTRTLTAAATGFTSATQSATINAATATVLAFTAPAQTLAAGACSAITGVQTRDGFGNASNVTAATTVNLATTSTGGGFFSDSTCLSAITSVSIAAATNTRTFFFKDTRVGTPTLTASATGYTSATQGETINAATATVLAFTSAPLTVTAGACSGQAALQTRDAFGNTSNVGAATNVSLASTSTGNTFYSDATCTTVVTSRSLAAGTSSATFYFKDTRAGTPTLTASATGFTAATQVETVNAAAITALAFATPAQTISAGGCSAVATVRTQDSFGNASNVTGAARAVGLSTTSGGGAFYSNATCTTLVTSLSIAIGSSTASFYYRDTQAGTPTLTASSAGISSATQGETVAASGPARLAYVTPVQTLSAGACSAVLTVQSQDSFGNGANVASSILVTLASSSGAGSFYADPSCNSPIAAVTLVVGTNTASFYYQDTRSGMAVASATTGSLTAAAQTEVINPAAPSKVAFVTAPQTVTAGSCSAQATLQTQDAFGNASPVAAASLIGLSSTSATGTFSAASGCGTAVSSVNLAAGQSTVSFWFKDPAAGTPTLTATLTGLSSATQGETVNAGLPGALVFVTPPQTLNAGACSAIATVEVRDANGNRSPVTAAATVSLTSSRPSGTFYTDPGCTAQVTGLPLLSGDSAASFYFKDTMVGSPTLTAAAAGLMPATQLQTITTAGGAARLGFITAAQSIVAGACSTAAVVQSQDSFGNPVSLAADTTVALSSSSGTGTFYSDASCTTARATSTITAGTNSATFYFKDTRSGTPTLTAAVAGFSNGTQLETIRAGNPTRLAFLSAAQSLLAGGCSAPVTVQLQDAYGNAATATAVTALTLTTSSAGGAFFTDPACGTAATGIAIAAAQSSATFYYRDTRSGTATITAAAAGLTSGTQAETVTAGAQSTLAFTTPAQTVIAGSCSGLVTVQLRDGFGNPSPVTAATAVALAATSATLRFYSDPLCTVAVTTRTIATNGSATSFYFKDNALGGPTLTASTPGVMDAIQVETVIAGSATDLAITSAPQTIVAGACSLAITVESRDGLGNTSPVTSDTQVVPISSAMTGSFYSDPGCTAAAASVLIAAGGSTARLYYKDTLVGTPSVTASNPGLNDATQAETIVPAAPRALAFTTTAQTLMVGSCSSVASLQVRDPFGNASPVLADTPLALASSSATGSFYSDAACATPAGAVTVAMGASAAGFYFKDTAAGPATLTASSAGLTPATQTATFVPSAAVSLAFATPARTFGAGACSPAITLETRDNQGNAAPVTANTAVALSSSATSTQFFTDAACTTMVPQVTIASGGQAATFYVKDSRVGAPVLTASSTALGSATQAQTITTGTPVRLGFSGAGLTATAGLCSPPLNVETRDTFGNPSPATSDVTATLTASSATLAFFSDPGCTTPAATVTIARGQTAGVVHFKDDKAGTPALTASATGFTSGTQNATVAAATPTGLFFASQPQTLPTAVCSAPAVIEVRDALGNPAPVSSPVRVSLSSTSTGGTFYADPQCSSPIAAINVAMGQSSGTFFYKDALPGMPRLTALAAGLTSVSQVETINPAGSAAALGFGTPALTLEAGTCSPGIEVQTQDAMGAPAPVTQAVDVTLTTGSTVAGLYGDPACTTRVTKVTVPANDYRATIYLKDAVVEPVVVNLMAAGLTPASQTQTLVCPATVDGAFCDDADLCNGRETCRGGACTPSTPLSCDDRDQCTTDSCSPSMGCVNAVTGSCCRTPGIARDANLFAAVGVPYRYNPAGVATLTKGTGPITWSTCASGPLGLRVDATTGAIDWVPLAAGPADVCLQATGACGTDMVTFTVDVTASPPAPPVAVITLPPTAAAGATVMASGGLSTPSPAFAYEWSFGDGTPLAYGADVTHAWALAGGYRARLRVYDQVGQMAEAFAPVAITSATCMSPPQVRIVADRTRGADTMSVTFTTEYDGTDPAPAYRWTFGDGTTALGATVSHTFGPGAYLVQLALTQSDGCGATDSVTIEVSGGGNLAPHCSVVASPIAGVAPLTTTFTAAFGDADGKVSSATWFFSDGVTSDAMRFAGVTSRVIDRPGALTALLEVVDDRGVTCRASAIAEAGNGQELFPPEIVTAPTLTAACGTPYVYGEDGVARATGSRPLTWSLGRGDTGKPEGMEIDANGKVTWTPVAGTEKTYDARVTIVAQNAAGSVEQDFVVKVDCPAATKPCGCSSTGFETLAVLLLLGLTSRTRRRKT